MTATTHAHFDKVTEALDVAAAFPDSIKGRTILITGVNRQGIGYTTAEAFASQAPQRLILAARSANKVQECVDSLHAKYPAIDIRPLLVDLGSQKSVRAAAEKVMGWSDVPAIHIVVNNAGVMRHGETANGPMPTSEDGIEDMLAVNHIGHFLLTNLIMPKILAAAKDAPTGSVRVVNLSSSGTFVSPYRASDIKWEKPASSLPENERPSFVGMRMAGMTVDESMAYIPTAAYGHSKTCNVLMALSLNERLFERYGVLALSLNPGEIKTELARNTDSSWLGRMVKRREEAGLMHWKTQTQGASTTLVAACDPKLTVPNEDGEGQYLENCQIGKAPAHSVDRQAAEKLWQTSQELVGQKFEY